MCQGLSATMSPQSVLSTITSPQRVLTCVVTVDKVFFIPMDALDGLSKASRQKDCAS